MCQIQGRDVQASAATGVSIATTAAIAANAYPLAVSPPGDARLAATVVTPVAVRRRAAG